MRIDTILTDVGDSMQICKRCDVPKLDSGETREGPSTEKEFLNSSKITKSGSVPQECTKRLKTFLPFSASNSLIYSYRRFARACLEAFKPQSIEVQVHESTNIDRMESTSRHHSIYLKTQGPGNYYIKLTADAFKKNSFVTGLE